MSEEGINGRRVPGDDLEWQVLRRTRLPIPSRAQMWAVLGMGVVVWVTQMVQGEKQSAQIDLVAHRLGDTLEIVKDHEGRIRKLEPLLVPERTPR